MPHTITWTDNVGGEVNIDVYRNNVCGGCGPLIADNRTKSLIAVNPKRDC